MAAPDELVEFVANQATPDLWAGWHRIRRRWHEESWSEDPFRPDWLEESELTRPDPFTIHKRFVRVRGGEIVSALLLDATAPSSPEYATSRHLIYASSFVLPERRRHRVAAGWLPTMVEVMDGLGATMATMSAHEEPGIEFLRWLGAEPRYAERSNRLDLRTVDWDMVEAWVTAGRERSPEARLERYLERIPEDRLEEITGVTTKLLSTIPLEGLDHGDIIFTPEMYHEWTTRLDASGGRHHTVLVREPDGSVSALTDVLKYPHEEGHVRQLFTGVDPAARGRGLGKWVKAAMLLQVRELHPDTVYITTENAGSNAAMLAINYQLGFRPYREATSYQIGREALGRRADAEMAGRRARP
jgi:GNAT superfamily N-acetyltransferase